MSIRAEKIWIKFKGTWRVSHHFSPTRIQAVYDEKGFLGGRFWVLKIIDHYILWNLVVLMRYIDVKNQRVNFKIRE
jgi:hypothetical protein